MPARFDHDPDHAVAVQSGLLPAAAALPGDHAGDRPGCNQSEATQRAAVRGELHLRFRIDPQAQPPATVVDLLVQRSPLRVVRAFALTDGAALVHLHNLSGGVLSGDHLAVTVEVDPGARAQLTTTGATRIYRRRAAAGTAIQETRMHVAAGGLLEYLPDPVIPYAGSSYTQRTQITLEENAGLFAWELMTPGREAHGECFAYDRLAWETTVAVVDPANHQLTPIAAERALLEPALRPLTALARLGRHRYMATFLACRVGVQPAQWSVVVQALASEAERLSSPDSWWGVSSLSAHGLMLRGIGVTGRVLADALPAFWRVAKRQLYGEDAIPPRKIY